MAAITFLVQMAAQVQNQVQVRTVSYPSGIGLGSVIAVVCSWQRNHSVGWAIVAGLLSWIYVVYFLLTRESSNTKTPGPSNGAIRT